jgi:hypothetical protein
MEEWRRGQWRGYLGESGRAGGVSEWRRARRERAARRGERGESVSQEGRANGRLGFGGFIPWGGDHGRWISDEWSQFCGLFGPNGPWFISFQLKIFCFLFLFIASL